MDDFIEAYCSLRAVLEEVVSSGVTDDIRAAIRVYLRTHCKECGIVIAESRRRAGETLCGYCGRPPLPAIRNGIHGDEAPL